MSVEKINKVITPLEQINKINEIIDNSIINQATGSYSLAIGDTTTSTANKYSVVIGKSAKTTADGAIAIGYGSTANSGVAIGRSATTSNSATLAIIGNASSNNAIAIGSGTVASGQYAIGIGNQSGVSGKYAIGLGYNADATAENAIQLGKGTNETANTLQVLTYPLLDLSTGKIPHDRLAIQFMPDYENGIDITSVLKASPYSYTPPTDGFIKFYAGGGEKVWNIGLVEDYSAGDINNVYYSNMGEGIYVTGYLLVYSNQTIYATTRTGNTAIFYPLKGIN